MLCDCFDKIGINYLIERVLFLFCDRICDHKRAQEFSGDYNFRYSFTELVILNI